MSILSSGGSWAWTPGSASFTLLDHIEGRCALALEDAQQYRPPTVAADDVRLDREPVPHLGHVLDVDRDSVDGADGDVVERLDQGRAGVQPDGVLDVPDLRRPGRDDQVLVGDRSTHVVGREPAAVELVRIEVHHHLPHLTAVRLGNPRPLDGPEPLDDEVRDVVVNL
jgi:hypothetical protein